MTRHRHRQRLIVTQRRRLILLACAGVLGYLALLSRAVQLQAVDAGWLARRARRQHHGTLQLVPRRGAILDRHGMLLAASADTESVAASPRRITDRVRVVRKLGRAMSIPPVELNRRLDPSRRFAWVRRWVSPEQADRVRRLDLEGIRLYPERRRFYPSGGLAAAYVGFAGRDGVGLSGLELAFDGALRGAPASLPFRRDARGRKLIQQGRDPVIRSGARIKLTLDGRLQHFAEGILQRAVEQTHARHAMLVALDPFAGDVLTLAQWPTFDPNRFWIEDPRAFRAGPFVDPFEPGSTLKPFVVALALEAGVVRPDEVLDCEQGRWRVGDRWIHDFEPHGRLTVREIVRDSSNIGAAKIAARLGARRLAEGLRRLGFGAPSGSGFPGEAAGVVHDLRETQIVELANLAFGQGILVTAVQLAAAGAALANGGHHVVPRLLLELDGPGGPIPWPAEPGERVLSERTARRVLEMMREAVRRGTGRRAALPHHAVAGKTGTAQKVVDGVYSSRHFVASFLGIVPVADPRLVVVIVIDDPQGRTTGGLVAAPLFREFGGFAVEQLALAREGSA